MSPEPLDSCLLQHGGGGDACSETFLWATSSGYCDTSPEKNLFIATEGRYFLSSRCGRSTVKVLGLFPCSVSRQPDLGLVAISPPLCHMSTLNLIISPETLFPNKVISIGSRSHNFRMFLKV